MEDKLEIIPMGGLEEVGKNMIMIGFGDEYIVIDAGMAFPDEDMLGVQCVIPNIDFLAKKRDKIKAILITHAHEDHIGAIPYLLNELSVPIYGTELTLGVLKNKLRYHKPKNKAIMKNVNPDTFNLQIGGMLIESFRTVHSIYDSVGYVIKTKSGNIVHMGDFKLDFHPIDNKGMDYKYLTDLSEEGVDLLISDSTNATKEGVSNTELSVAKELEVKMSAASGLTIMSTFSSSLPRIQSIVNVAEKLNKKVAFAGVSMLNNVKVAIKSGNIFVNESSIVSIKEVNRYKREDVVVITTGAQGEVMAGLMRLANDQNENITLQKEDTIIFSSGVVPGNEKSVSNLVNKLLKKDVTVIRGDEIHTSGHGHSGDLKMIIDILKPRHLMPFHGEYSMLLKHQELAMDMGMDKDNILLCSNSDKILFSKEEVTINKSIFDKKDILIDQTERGYVSEVVGRDRSIMAKSGVAVVNINIENIEREVVHVSIKLKGVAVKADLQKISLDIKNSFLNDFVRLGKVNEALRNNYDMIKTFSKIFRKYSGIRPMIIPFINE